MQQVLRKKTLVVGQGLINSYADMTCDHNPLHVNDAFAAQSRFGSIIAHGTLSLNLVWEAIEATFDDIESVELEVSFRQPVKVNDVVRAAGELADAANGVYRVRVANQNGVDVIEGSATVTLRNPVKAGLPSDDSVPASKPQTTEMSAKAVNFQK